MSFPLSKGEEEEDVQVKTEDIRACRCCLDSDCALFDIQEKRLERVFFQLTGLPVSKGLACSICVELLRKFRTFRARCQAAEYLLRQTNYDYEKIKTGYISFDGSSLKHNLQKSEISFTCYEPCFQNTFKLSKLSKKNVIFIDIPSTTEEIIDDDINVKNNESVDEHGDFSSLSEDVFDDINLENEKFDKHISHVKQEESFDNGDINVSENEEQNHDWDCSDDNDVQNNEIEKLDDKESISDVNREESIDNDDVNVSENEEQNDDFYCTDDNVVQNYKNENMDDQEIKSDVNQGESIDNDDVNVSENEEQNDDFNCSDENSDVQNYKKEKKYEQEIKCDVNQEESVDNDDVNVNENEDQSVSENKEQNDDFSWSDDNNVEDNIVEPKEKSNKQDTAKKKEKRMIIESANLYRSIVKKALKQKKKDIFDVFEMIYEQYAIVKDSKNHYDEHLDDDTLKIRKYLKVNKELEDMFNLDIEFLNIDDQIKAVKDIKKSEKYIKAQFKCELCCKFFTMAETYKDHKNKWHNPSLPRECKVCHYRFADDKSKKYERHCASHHRTQKCHECGLKVGLWCHARTHQQMHRGATTVMCELCCKCFTTRSNYNDHYRTVHRSAQSMASCAFCQNAYMGKLGLKVHMHKSHPKAVQCASCSTWFLDAEVRKKHAKTGRCKRQHSSCPLCGHNFKTEALMKDHLSSHKKNTFKCTHCKRPFESLPRYKEHQRTHTHSYKRMLNRRKREQEERETGIKRIRKTQKKKGRTTRVCEVCGQSFRCLAVLKEHQTVHTGEKPFHCDHCPKTYRLKKTLRCHMTTHSDLRPHKCPHCPKSFRQRQHLTVHQTTHTKERNQECAICHKRFSQRTNMHQHVRAIHGGEGLLPKRRVGRPSKSHIKKQ